MQGGSVKGLGTLGADLEKTDIFITHMHADHSGLVSTVAGEKSVVYCSEIDAQRIKWSQSTAYWAENRAHVASYGFPLHEYSKDMLRLPGQKYSPDRVPDFTAVKENDLIEIGAYRFFCVETPGIRRDIYVFMNPTAEFLYPVTTFWKTLLLM